MVKVSEEQALSCKRLLAKVRTRLVLGRNASAAFYSCLAMRLRLSVERIGTAATDGRRLAVDPEWFASLTPDEQLAVVVHEVLHCAYRHMVRREGRDLGLFNIACDLTINFIVEESGYKLPACAMFPGRRPKGAVAPGQEWLVQAIADLPVGLSAEAYYGKLRQAKREAEEKARKEAEEQAKREQEEQQKQQAQENEEGEGDDEEGESSGDDNDAGGGHSDGEVVGEKGGNSDHGGGGKGSDGEGSGTGSGDDNGADGEAEDAQGRGSGEKLDEKGGNSGHKGGGKGGDGEGSGTGSGDDNGADGEAEESRGDSEAQGATSAHKAGDSEAGCGEDGGATADLGGCGGIEDAPATSEAERKALSDEWEVATLAAAQEAAQRGDLPGGIRGFVEKLRRPVPTAKELLREFLLAHAPTDYSWRQPSRRHIGRGVYLPALDEESLPTIAISIDTSGSIGDETLKLFLGWLREIAEQRPVKLVLLWHHCELYAQTEWTPADGDIMQPEVATGGTSHRPVFDAIEKLDEPPACLVALTDCETEYPAREPEYPTLWVVERKPYRAPPFGRLVVTEAGAA